jgi:hypothetical protein
MTEVSVTPEEFTMVDYNAARIAALVARVADDIGLPGDTEIRVEVDEHTPLGASSLASLDPITIKVESGALEDARNPRHLSERNVIGLSARHLFRVLDRSTAAFADAPDDADLTSSQAVAWDVYSVGRTARLGYPSQRGRRLYHFRIRHGFNDRTDEVFERLWSGEGLTWRDIEAACHETAASLQIVS